MKIEIVSSNVNELSSMSSLSRKSILEVLSKYYSDVRITLIDTTEGLEMLVLRKPDLVFLGMKFVPSITNKTDNTKVWISEYLQKNDIAYTGSNASAHLLEFNKDQAKEIAEYAGLKTAKFMVLKEGKLINSELRLKYPLFIKPTDQGGGTGIDTNSLVYNVTQLNKKVTSIFTDLGSNALVEEYLPGREFSVAVLKNEDSSEYSLMPIELVAPRNITGARFLSASIKKADTESYKKVEDQKIIDDITTLAINVFTALGARDYGRIDIRMDKLGKPHFLEANLIPSLLRDYGNFPKACLLNNDIQYEVMILRIVNLALNRKTVLVNDPLNDDSSFVNFIYATT